MFAGSHQCEGCIVCWKTSTKDWETVASMTPWRLAVGPYVRTNVCCGCYRNEFNSSDDSGSLLWDTGLTFIYSFCLFIYLFIPLFIFSLCTLSYDRFIASPKISSAESASSFSSQYLPFLFLTVIQWLFTSFSPSSRRFFPVSFL